MSVIKWFYCIVAACDMCTLYGCTPGAGRLKNQFLFQANQMFEFPDLFGRYHGYREKVISGEDPKVEDT